MQLKRPFGGTEPWAKKHAGLLVVLLCVLVLHLGLFVYDLAQPSTFLKGDRAGLRLGTIEGLLASTDSGVELQSFLATHGIVGDYALHGIVFGLVGQYGLILVQIFLLLVSVVYLYKLAWLIRPSQKLALVTVLIYVLLPHTIIYPHLLTVELMFIPFVIVSFYLLGRYAITGGGPSYLVGSAVLLGVAILVRPLLALWPTAVFVLAAISLRPKFRAGHWIAFLCISVLPLVLWMSFIWFSTGEFTMGESGHSLSRNLYLRVERISEALSPSEEAKVRESYLTEGNREGRESLGVFRFFQFAAEHPGPYIEHLGRDAVMFWAKSGVNRISLDYFDLFPESQTDRQGALREWRAVLEQEGWFGMLRFYWGGHSGAILITGLGLVLFVLFLLVASYGAFVLVLRYFRRQDTPGHRTMYALLCTFPPYVFFVSQFAQRVPSRDRAPAEFVLSLLFVVGASHLYDMCRTKRGDRRLAPPDSRRPNQRSWP